MLTIENKLKVFFETYRDYYSKDEQLLVSKNLLAGEVKDITWIAQIRSYLKLNPEEDRYLGYLAKIKEYFDLGQDIIEVGSGKFPIMSYYIDCEQTKINCGSITAYDPDLIGGCIGNVILKHENFAITNDISNCKFLIGIMPCQATEIFVKKANMERKEFFLAMCSCSPYYGNYKKLYEFIKQTQDENTEIIVDYLDKKYHIEEAILIKKKK